MRRRDVVSAFILRCCIHVAHGRGARLHVIRNLRRNPTQVLDESRSIRQVAAVHIEHHFCLGLSRTNKQLDRRLRQRNVLLRSHTANISVNDFGSL